MAATNIFNSLFKQLVPREQTDVALLPEVQEVSNIDVSQIPSYIEKSVLQLRELSHRIDESASAGRDAARAAKDAEGKRATFSWHESAAKEREVITALQLSGTAQAKAIETFSHAQKLTFEYLSGVTKILRALFVLGCASLAKNRAVVRELEARLRGASKERLNDLARQELETLLMQLNEQRDILERQEQLGRNQREQAGLIAQNKEMIQTVNAKNAEQDAELVRQRGKDDEHDSELERQRAKDVEHDRLLRELTARVERMDTCIIPLWLKIAVFLNFLLAISAIVLSVMR